MGQEMVDGYIHVSGGSEESGVRIAMAMADKIAIESGARVTLVDKNGNLLGMTTPKGAVETRKCYGYTAKYGEEYDRIFPNKRR